MSDFIEGAKYGKEIYEDNDDDIPRKKQRLGRREEREKERKLFHGAFKGGFSAGHFGTVGSKEGWAPRQFKSSRSDGKSRFEKPKQSLDDFMDSEDEESFGSGSNRIRSKAQFGRTSENETKKVSHTDRQLLAFSVESLLKPSSQNIGEKLLNSMGWKAGQGIGKKVSLKKKQPDLATLVPSTSTVSPDDVLALVTKFKENTFGIGYKGMERPTFKAATTQDHVFGVIGKGKQIRISGQAFGVGVDNEDDDMDVYSREDLSQYDFELGPKKQAPQKMITSGSALQDRFQKAKQPCIAMKYYKPPALPKDFRIESLTLHVKTETAPSDESERLVGRKERFSQMKQTEKTEWDSQQHERAQAEEQKREDESVELMRRILASRFVSRGTDQEPAKPSEGAETPLKKPRRGGRMTTEWFPDKLLCLRFNVPCPYMSAPERKSQSKSKIPLFTALALAKKQREEQQDDTEERVPALPELAALPSEPPSASVQVPPVVTQEMPQSSKAGSGEEEVRPPMDLFKAIFADSDSESETENASREDVKISAAATEEGVREETAEPRTVSPASIRALDSACVDEVPAQTMIPVNVTESRADILLSSEPVFIRTSDRSASPVSIATTGFGSGNYESFKKAEIPESRADKILSVKPVFVRTSERAPIKPEPLGGIGSGSKKETRTADDIKRLAILERLREFDDDGTGSSDEHDVVEVNRTYSVKDSGNSRPVRTHEVLTVESGLSESDDWVEATSERKKDKKKKKKHKKDKKKKKKSKHS